MSSNYPYPAEYWNRLFEKGRLGWDMGSVSPPLKAYFDQLTDRSLKILIPGSGRGWEAEYLFRLGFTNVFYHDFSPLAHRSFLERVPDFPKENRLYEDFFLLKGKYDLVVEQAFFSSIPVDKRAAYVRQVLQLLKPGGKFVGLLFNHHFTEKGPPFGGSYDEYKALFFNLFNVKVFADCYNSVKPRQGREFFFILQKPDNKKDNFFMNG
jgi:SAM-dependent methyltransferase